MATGIYGNIRPADVSPLDMEVYYTFAPNRETQASETFSLEPTDIISELSLPTTQQRDGEENLMEGLYNLTLSSSVFNQVGIYTIYIRPKILTDITVENGAIKIIDCGVLSALPTVKGIVIDGNKIDVDLRANNALQGYKIEYLDSDNNKIRNTVRYVVTSNKVIPVTENIGNTSQTAVRYRFDDSGNLIFLQVTPASASNVKPNVTPFIGTPNQTILISNTYFNPIAIEVELVQNDIESLVNFVAGEQIKDVDNGILTYYDANRNITRQFNLYEIKDDVTDTSLFEVKEQRVNIDPTQDFDEITEDVEQ
jgi:hypothetical protein